MWPLVPGLSLHWSPRPHRASGGLARSGAPGEPGRPAMGLRGPGCQSLVSSGHFINEIVRSRELLDKQELHT